ncbi:MAG: 2-hydroxyacid dehydrogenase [Rubrivivax sp.]
MADAGVAALKAETAHASEPVTVVTGPGLAPWMVERLAGEFRVLPVPEDFMAGSPCKAFAAVRVAVTSGAAGLPNAALALLPGLSFIANFGNGVDRLPLAQMRERGIGLSNTAGAIEGCVADHAMGLLLAQVRQIARAARLAHGGHWARPEIGLSPRVHGRRLGILGMGRIGQAVARRAAGFDMEVAYCNRRPRPDSALPWMSSPLELARWCDFLVIACPGGPATRHLVDRDVLHALGPDGVLVNVARGSVVDQQALIEALNVGTLGGAALDVLEDEPVIPAALAASQRVVITPHIAGSTDAAWQDAFELVLANGRAFLGGAPPLTPGLL